MQDIKNLNSQNLHCLLFTSYITAIDNAQGINEDDVKITVS